MKTGFCTKKFGENGMILLTYNRLIHHSNDNDKNVHPLICPKIRMAKVRIDGILKKTNFGPNRLLWKKKSHFCQKRQILEFLTVFG
jgi:hypothetical protein